jgi:hypothetical protein
MWFSIGKIILNRLAIAIGIYQIQIIGRIAASGIAADWMAAWISGAIASHHPQQIA